MEFLNVLTRNEMKNLKGGGEGCGPNCSGCIEDGSGPFCFKWACNDGFCYPVASTCCIVLMEG